MRRSPLVLLLVAGLSLPGCGAKTPPSASSDLPAVCLDEATIGAAAGFAVAVQRSTIKQSADAANCTFLATDQAAHPGANVSILLAPASFANQALTDISDSAARAQTTAKPIQVGQGGLAYESPQRCAAATVVGGKLVGVTIDGMGLSSPGACAGTVTQLLQQAVSKLGIAADPVPLPSGAAPGTSPPAKALPTAKPPVLPKTPSPSAGKPRGALIFDPFSAPTCIWVPRMFVDLSGHAKPGVKLNLPLWAAQLDTTLTLDIRSQLTGRPTQASSTVTVSPPEWRGTVAMSLAFPVTEDYFSASIELDTGNRLAGKTDGNSQRTVQGTLPTPRPSSDQSFTCNKI